MLVGPLIDVIYAIEPVRNEEARRQVGEDAGHEGELTAALRLIGRMNETYGSSIDALVFDALYANGSTMTKLGSMDMVADTIRYNSPDQFNQAERMEEPTHHIYTT